MGIYILAFVLGVALLQTQATLPPAAWTLALLPLIALFLWLSRGGPRFAWAGQAVAALLFLGAGFFWAALRAEARLADALPREWEGRDVQLVGVVSSLPRLQETGIRFELDVERVLTSGASVPGRVSLAWYKERGGEIAEIHAGSRWRLTVRLKRPHGGANPHGFDFEAWALERDLRATGYLRRDPPPERLASLVYQPPYLIARAREAIRSRIYRALCGSAPECSANAPYAGVLAALAIGDQDAIPRSQWQVFTRTGVNHLMSISGLHITMISGLVFSLASFLWRRSPRLMLRVPAPKLAALAGLAAALGYALLAGFASPPSAPCTCWR